MQSVGAEIGKALDSLRYFDVFFELKLVSLSKIVACPVRRR